MLSIGVARSGDFLAVATTRRGEAVEEAVFPSNTLGEEAIRAFLADCVEPFRLAVTGSAMNLAFGCAGGRDQEVVVVSAAVAPRAAALASYAARGL